MSIYQINFLQKAIELLPPDKRPNTFVKWIYSLLKPSEYNDARIFTDYKVGAVYPVYIAATYSKFQRVIFGQSVYESIIDSNTTAPPNATGWRVYQDSFIGVDERLTYNHQKISLEWGLNKRFGTTFRQPNLVSDIYITTNVVVNPPFIVGGDEPISSVTYRTNSTEFIINNYSFGNFFNFTIYVPVAVFNALSSNASAREPIIRNFVDRYNSAGITYNVVTY
jgi:hypothetical protein